VITHDQHFDQLTRKFSEAALGGSWEDALRGLAAATGA